MPFDPDEGEAEYDRLHGYAAKRYGELSGMLQPYLDVTDQYGKLICRLTLLLGTTAPADIQDSSIRDLLADVFDFLMESRKPILESKIHMAFPLLRRAFESLSLLSLCCLDQEWAEKWQAGKEISNAVIRKTLAQYPMGENEAILKEEYSFFGSSEEIVGGIGFGQLAK